MQQPEPSPQSFDLLLNDPAGENLKIRVSAATDHDALHMAEALYPEARPVEIWLCEKSLGSSITS